MVCPETFQYFELVDELYFVYILTKAPPDSNVLGLVASMRGLIER